MKGTRKRRETPVSLATEAFEMTDLIRGELTGGIDAPRIILSVTERDDGSVAIRWKNPDTCGLSDRIYHHTDTSVHEDIYRIEDDRLTVNGSPETFMMDRNVRSMLPKQFAKVQGFYTKWDLQKP